MVSLWTHLKVVLLTYSDPIPKSAFIYCVSLNIDFFKTRGKRRKLPNLFKDFCLNISNFGTIFFFLLFQVWMVAGVHGLLGRPVLPPAALPSSPGTELVPFPAQGMVDSHVLMMFWAQRLWNNVQSQLLQFFNALPDVLTLFGL